MAALPEREAILEFLATNDLRYQRIELPHGLATPGPDRSDTARLVFPHDLAGESVLDVGCYLGFFCHEAKRRNAGRVLGLEMDDERLRQARALAGFAGHDIEFRRFDLESDDLDERFDVVLLLNVIHHARRPMDMLAKVARYARRRLVLEVPGIGDGPMKKYLKREFRLHRRHIRWLEELPLIGVGRNGALDARREQSFFFTAGGIRNVLLEHGRTFARVDVQPSPRKGRFVAIAHRRRIGRLVLIAGPSGVGKSRLWERLLGDPALAARLGFEQPERWTHVTALDLRSLETPEIDRLALHYDILRPVRGGARLYERDEALDVIGCAEHVSVLTLHCEPSQLVRRLEARLERDQGDALELANEAIALARGPGQLRRIYEEWTAFCDARRLEPRMVDTSDDRYETAGREGLERLLRSCP